MKRKIESKTWLNTKWGRIGKFGVLGATIVVYPIGTLLLNGPLLKYYFSWRYKTSSDLPEHLRAIVDSQYKLWLDRESRSPKDAVVHFSCSSSDGRIMKVMDTIGHGSMGVRFGARISLPFYTQLRNLDEAIEYCKSNLKVLNFIGEPVRILWDSNVGTEIAKTFVLGEQEIKFLVLRDLCTYDGYAAYITRALSWATFSTFSSIFTYWMHQRKIFQQSFHSFIALYLIFLLFAWFGSLQWYKLYKFVCNIHADSVAAQTSPDHCYGGKEFYWKMLRRNRILRELIPAGTISVKPSGDIRKMTTSILTRFDNIKDIDSENEEIKETTFGDD
ncbi:unnamed protein product [Dracunculus medinensis]|uniref:Transmembrane protein n=1 Tax=Dracunculus medinensis TaxID=318479 RepID=A0A0N4U1R7_DRAME|nr:unnamed protein product [Dracunculus medinensis]